MTTIAVWKSHSIEPHLGNPAIWVVTDSRASRTTNVSTTVLTDRCAKLVEIDIRASIDGSIHRPTMLMAVAGNTLVAHNTIFCTQLALRHLTGKSLPTLLEVTQFVGDVVLNITKDVGVSLGKAAECEVLLIANDPTSPKVYSLKPSYAPTISYVIEEVDSFPYVTGSDKERYLALINETMKSKCGETCEQSSIDQVPIRAFDQLFVAEQASQQTGGELQMAAVGEKDIQRYMPMRWNDSTQLYEFYMFGMNTWEKMVGGCNIGIWPWQLDDIPPQA